MSVSLLLVILPVPLTYGKTTFLFPLKVATPQQKAFCVLAFAKTNAIVAVQRAFTTEFGIDPPIVKVLHGVVPASGGGHIEHL